MGKGGRVVKEKAIELRRRCIGLGLRFVVGWGDCWLVAVVVVGGRVGGGRDGAGWRFLLRWRRRV